MPETTPFPRIGKFAGRTLEHATPASSKHKPPARRIKGPPVTRKPPGFINRPG